jgi:hypothetical protein
MLQVEIICTACGEETLLKREPIYEGLAKTGELLTCVSCGHQFENEDTVPFKQRAATPNLFAESDWIRPAPLFDADENKRLCRYCANYVINPFMQYCSTRKKEVQATDTCEQFTEKQERKAVL